MARCRCTGESCTCVLAAGSGVQLAGTGSPTNPWIITVPPNSNGTIETSDTPSVVWSISGQGTFEQPFVLVARAVIGTLIDFIDSDEVAFTVTGAGSEADPLQVTADLPNISTAGGSAGMVLTQQPDGTFAPGPPSTVAPGL